MNILDVFDSFVFFFRHERFLSAKFPVAWLYNSQELEEFLASLIEKVLRQTLYSTGFRKHLVNKRAKLSKIIRVSLFIQESLLFYVNPSELVLDATLDGIAKNIPDGLLIKTLGTPSKSSKCNFQRTNLRFF